ncbi:MAG TPA: 4-alpha-glucanotransferase [Gammaproteobacteria bacterium]|nr:4-alpha-glucanotransferase [Gammaproteobacteria bacterium]
MTESAAPLERLRRVRGIAPGFIDYRGREHALSAEALRALLAAMGHREEDERALERAAERLELRDWQRVLPPVVVLRERGRVPFTVLAPLLPRVCWEIRSEQGECLRGEADPATLPVLAERGIGELWHVRLGLELPELEPGYHDLQLEKADGAVLGHTRLVVAPSRCFEPEFIRRGERSWGPAIQLYTLRSARNWGIGDFTDLAGFAEGSAVLGADFVGLNPLHALFPADPALCGPYSPSSRHFLNILYIDPEAVEDFASCVEAQRLLATPEFQARLESLRDSAEVDYPGVTACKLEVLRLLHHSFTRRAAAQRRAAFETFRAEQGEALERFAGFHALQAHFAAAGTLGGWTRWPEPYRAPGGAAALSVLDVETELVEFHCWLQWIARQQLDRVERRARRAGLRLGLYRDLAVGPHAGGAETWGEEGLYALDASVGAPPDALAPQGQDWGLPPMDPDALAERAYEPFITLLRSNMSRHGALRIDHVMALFRQWWVPRGRASSGGGYVHYPLEDLAAILALESHRQQCLVIGEDLGTVPPEVRRAMSDFRIYSYRVLWFERDGAGRFLPPGAYPEASLATVSTHDLPPLAGYLRGTDLELRARLADAGADAAVATQAGAERAETQKMLLETLTEASLWPVEGGAPAREAAGRGPATLAEATQLYLARAKAALLTLQPEDWLGMEMPVNMPGTHAEYPNWRRKLIMDWPELLASPGVRRLSALVNTARATVVSSTK